MTEADKDPPAELPESEAAPNVAANEAELPASDEAAPPAAEPKVKKRKKGRRKQQPELETGPRAELDREGRERPAFLLNFPRDPELEPLIVAFELGNYAHVREFAPRLVEQSERPEVKRAAGELLKRIEPDPLVKFLLAVALALFVVVVALVYHSHG